MYSTTLLVLLITVFVLQLAIPGFTELFWFNPASVSTQPWGFFTSIFLHGGLMHLFFNGFALLMFGPFLETRIGSRKFLELFLAAGVIGSFSYYAFVALGVIPSLPALGASGAIYGILGALAVLMPNMTVFVMFVPMPMRYAAVFWVLIEFLGTFNPASGIASAAHLGGLLVGVAYAKYFARS
ncbi:MAG: rhomboid family intramembrane serine protease [Candidatus Norongarragalinales archaeon]